MRLSDGLKAKRAELLDRIETMSKAAEAEGRMFSETEAKAWDIAMAEIKNMDAKIERQTAVEDLLAGRSGGSVQPIAGSGPGLITEDGTVLRALRKTDKLVDLLPRGVQREQISIGQVLRGIVHGKWKGMKPLERAVGETGDSIFPVPEYISNDWLDLARNASVAMAAGAQTIPMRSLTERIVGVTTDPVFTFRKEHKVIPESDIVLGPIDIKARLAGAIVRTSIELLEDSPMADNLIQQVLISAAAQKIDWALLAGDGAQTGDLDNPTGLINWPGVNSTPGAIPPVNYDAFIDAYGQVLANNGVPNALIGSAALPVTMAKIKTGLAGDMTTLVMPEPVASLDRYFTNTMPPQTAVLGDFTMLAWAMRTGATLEVTRTGGDGTFSKAQVLIRLYFRGDTVVLRPKWFSKITGLAAPLEAREGEAPNAPARTDQRAAAAAR